MLIRREQPGDVATVQSGVEAAFARPEAPDETPVEVGLLEGLRVDDGWLPQLSMVAVEAPRPATTPNRQRPDARSTRCSRCPGRTARRAARRARVLRAQWLPTVRDIRISAPNPTWGNYFQVRPLHAYRPVTGTFTYAQPFGRL